MRVRRRRITISTAGPAALAVSIAALALAAGSGAAVADAKLLWGARIDGEVYGRGDAPWDAGSWSIFERHAGKNVSLLHFGQPAPWRARFAREPLELVRARGAVPYMSMGSGRASLRGLATGRHDRAWTAWARAARRYGRPFLLRWNWEMNGTWFDWGAQARADPQTFVAAWRHIHRLVRAQGATNVTWVWCPNVVWRTSTPLSRLYPGDGYVDWTCMDGYNRGTNPLEPYVWQSFHAVMQATYDQLLALAPAKPILVGEIASTEHGGSKAAWIRDMLETQLPLEFPRIKAVAWFNWNITSGVGRHDWPLESSAAAQAAFAAGIAQPAYVANEYGNPPLLTKVGPPQ